MELSEDFFLWTLRPCRILTHPFPKRSGHPALLGTPGASSINSAAFHKTPCPPGRLSSKCVSVHRDQSHSGSSCLCRGRVLTLRRGKDGGCGPGGVQTGTCVHMGGGWCSFPWLLRLEPCSGSDLCADPLRK